MAQPHLHPTIEVLASHPNGLLLPFRARSQVLGSVPKTIPSELAGQV